MIAIPTCFGTIEVNRPQSRAENDCDSCPVGMKCEVQYQRIAELEAALLDLVCNVRDWDGVSSQTEYVIDTVRAALGDKTDD